MSHIFMLTTALFALTTISTFFFYISLRRNLLLQSKHIMKKENIINKHNYRKSFALFDQTVPLLFQKKC